MVRCYGGKTNDHNQLVAEVRGVKIVNIDSYHFMKLECEGKERESRLSDTMENAPFFRVIKP